MTRRGHVNDPAAAVGLYSAFGGMRGAYAPDYVDHTVAEPERADEPDPDAAHRRGRR